MMGSGGGRKTISKEPVQKRPTKGLIVKHSKMLLKSKKEKVIT